MMSVSHNRFTAWAVKSRSTGGAPLAGEVGVDRWSGFLMNDGAGDLQDLAQALAGQRVLRRCVGCTRRRGPPRPAHPSAAPSQPAICVRKDSPLKSLGAWFVDVNLCQSRQGVGCRSQPGSYRGLASTAKGSGGVEVRDRHKAGSCDSVGDPGYAYTRQMLILNVGPSHRAASRGSV